ncbi:uncharacterized protein PHACADRAFT_265816 [Phanerochaete carnosa HHB-10118-sp]|uniref:Uncharacterized protein n=1 Tax=Phanerochaete carnosa (strain HHB-10118-sp) TaxID=650164 RepID=K5UHX3_PHACS|nr:uncharacterized protein PHACADRAFT_265816 [Phanerochaete carnosa HHB-10118-sp]EKM49126.1 hypothetical protein PHACADRAFT_265816 [Phanerochaete carnosa HHB-10118-sp]
MSTTAGGSIAEPFVTRYNDLDFDLYHYYCSPGSISNNAAAAADLDRVYEIESV